MNIPKFSVKYPVTVAMLMLGICLLGIISLNRLGTDLLPSIYNPRIVVELRSGEKSPLEMEDKFGRQIEGELGTISRVVDVQTTCSLGRLVATITFNWGTDMDFALLDVQKKVTRFESEPEVDNVTIARYDPQQEPIAIYAVQSHGAHDLDELRRIAENVIQRNLERLDGVARVQTFGGVKGEIRITLDEYKLKAFGLQSTTIVNKLKEANANASGGKLEQDGTSYLIKGIGEFSSIEEVGSAVVGYKTANEDSVGTLQQGSQFSADKIPIFLSYVADIEYAPEERTDLVRLNGGEAIGLYIYKEAQDNTVLVMQTVSETIAAMQEEMPGIHFTLINSQARFINGAIGEVKTTAIIGVILAILILYAFLRHFGVTIIVSIAIPLSILATFTLMYFQHLTLNVMTLGGLALGAGMLVDNAIVVIENIFRRVAKGEGAEDAAIRGTSEVGVAIVASTLTTIIVFLPIVYVEGVAAELFREQAWVVAFSLLSSLLVAFLVIPVLAARLFRKREIAALTAQELRFPFYERLLEKALQNRGKVVIFALFLLASAALLFPVIDTEFIPHSQESQIQIDLDLSPGTPLEYTSRVLAAAESRIHAVLGDSLEDIFSTVNVRTVQNLVTDANESGEHRASILLNMNKEDKFIEPAALIQQLRPALQVPGANTNFRIRESGFQGVLGSNSAPVFIQIRGQELEDLRAISDRLVHALNGLDLLQNIESGFQLGRPEIRLKVDRVLAASFNLDVQQVTSVVRNRLAGEIATTFYTQGEERDIRVLYSKSNLDELKNLTINSPDGSILRLKDITRFEIGEGPKEIKRSNQSRVAYVSAQLQKSVSLGDAVKKVEGVLQKIDLKPGFEVRFAGEEAARQESFQQLQFALWLSVILVYMTLASLFESFLHPFTILLTLPLAGVGVVYAFLLLGEPLSVMAYIGIIMLAGIAANDSIVLVDYVNRLRITGMSRQQALLQAGRDRLRPILMTSATTILALLPLTIGLGEGARLRAPMAIAVIGGLITSTILTLVVIPVVYDLIDRKKE
ncbi:MAG: efflux RND transporter permease subunit [Deferribacteres bacterium]|nr:efflux RND transporter permease subunit [Deferribacteres bacterium]